MAHCDHMIRDPMFDEKRTCPAKARFHYRSTTGLVVKLCTRHAYAESHRWKNPRPINEVV